MMKMLTKEITKRLPRLYAQEDVPTADKVVHVKFFQPWGRWTWWAIEGEPVGDADYQFFGYVQGLAGCDEWGYWNLSQLEEVRGPGGLKIERDLWFTPTKVSEIKEIQEAVV